MKFECYDFRSSLNNDFQGSATFFDIVPLFFSGEDKIHHSSVIM